MKGKIWIIVAAAALFALLMSGAVFAEGAEPPPAVEPGAQPLAGPTEAPDATPSAEASPAPLDGPGALFEVESMDTSEGLSVDQAPVVMVEEVELSAEAPLELVLTDAQGETLDLASQATADILALPDPYFFIKGVRYPHATIMEAINDIVAIGILPDGGMVYVEDGVFTELVTIDGVTHTILAGLKGMQSDHGSSATTITDGVTLRGLTGGFTLMGFTVQGPVSIVNNTGNIVLDDLDVSNASGPGIEIGANGNPHQGNATLTNVKSNDNSTHGAVLFTTGNIIITNSSFDGNGGNGLRVESSAGAITLKGVTSSHNGARGIYNINGFNKTFTLQHIQVNDNRLYGVDAGHSAATGAFTADTLYAQRNNLTSGSAISGVKVTTNGAVTLKHVLIENTKAGDGLYLIHWDSAAPILLEDVVSRDNDLAGMRVYSKGNITLASVKSTDNSTIGALLYSNGPDGMGSITLSSKASEGAAGGNDFSDNGGLGLDIRCNKNVTLANLDASGNGGKGLNVETPGNLTINKTLSNWMNGFNDNGESGIHLRVDGNVSLGYCMASDNTQSGVYFDTRAKNVTVTGGFFDNNGYGGLSINASGNVVLADIGSASSNGQDSSHSGIQVFDAASVTLKNSSKTDMTSMNGNSAEGLNIQSTGSVSVAGVAAWDNGSHGVYIDNRVWPGGKPVSLTRMNSGSNAGYGAQITTAGSVSLQDIWAVDNDTFGVGVHACVEDGLGGCYNTANVTLKGSNGFSDNGQAGLVVQTKGAVNLAQLDAFGNTFGGVRILNAYNTPSPVTLGGNVLSTVGGNQGFGIWVESHGAITLKAMSVYNTIDFVYGAEGAVYLTNQGPAKKGITLTDVEILNNEQIGLRILTDGSVSLQGVSASYGSILSGWIDEDSPVNGVRERLSGGWNNEDQWHFMGESGDSYTITLTSSEFTPMLFLEDEWGNWLEMDENMDGDGTAEISFSPSSDGEYILRVQVSGWGWGVYVLTFGGNIFDQLFFAPFDGALIDTPASVSVSSSKTNFSRFDGNNANGLNIISGSSVTLLNVSASNNYFKGVNVAANNGNVSLGNNHPQSLSSFNGNGAEGAMIFSGGTITLGNRLLALNNGSDGFYLDNGAAASKAVTIKGVQANGNFGMGIRSQSHGATSLMNVETLENGLSGTVLQTESNVTISGKNVFSDNGSQGLYVDTSGALAISGVLAENNGLEGLCVESRGVGKTALIKSSVLRFNGASGLYLNAYGNVTLDGVQSLLNTGSGVDIQPTDVQALIKNSVMMGNTENGIRVQGGRYTLANTFYFGNGDAGLYLYH